MSRPSGAIARAFERADAEGRAALIVYTTAGYPEISAGLDALLALADGGADIIELGVPFSDPLADGPTIQKSSFDAIASGVDMRWTLDTLRRFREVRETPVVLFSYLNPVLNYGIDAFVNEAVASGADGLLLTDLPVDADRELEMKLEASPLDIIRLIAPTTTPERARHIAAHSEGFIYFVSRTGVTGTRQELPASLTEEVSALRAAVDLPVAVGFGISTPEQAARVADLAEGVIVGSAVIEAFRTGGIEGAGRLVRELRGALTRSEA